LLAKLKEKESNPDSEFDSEWGKWIIDANPSVTIATANIQTNESEDLDEGEHPFHSQMWVNESPLHFIIDSGR
jgi:hypothetical protein